MPAQVASSLQSEIQWDKGVMYLLAKGNVGWKYDTYPSWLKVVKGSLFFKQETATGTDHAFNPHNFWIFGTKRNSYLCRAWGYMFSAPRTEIKGASDCSKFFLRHSLLLWRVKVHLYYRHKALNAHLYSYTVVSHGRFPESFRWKTGHIADFIVSRHERI